MDGIRNAWRSLLAAALPAAVGGILLSIQSPLLAPFPPLLFGVAIGLTPRIWGGTRTSYALLSGLACILLVVQGWTLAGKPTFPMEAQVRPDSVAYVDGARNLVAGKGLISDAEAIRPAPLRYPPGFSLALTPFVLAIDSFPENVQIGNRFYVLLSVVVALIVAWRMAGPTAAACTCTLLTASPFLERHILYIMSDCLAATFSIAILGLLHRPTDRSIRWAGLLGGISVLIRFTGAFNIVALAMAVPKESRRLLVWTLPGLTILGLYQWATFGGPMKTGVHYHVPGLVTFAWKHAAHPRTPYGDILSQGLDGPVLSPDALNGQFFKWLAPWWLGNPMASMENVLFYPALLIGLFWVFSPPLTQLVGLTYAATSAGNASSRFVLGLAFVSVTAQIFYFYQGGRFLAPIGSCLTIVAATAIAKGLDRLTNSRLATESPRETSSPAAPSSRAA